MEEQSKILSEAPNQGNTQAYSNKNVSYLTGKEMLQSAKKEKFLKAVTSELPSALNDQHILSDISLAYKGPEEDKFFADKPQLHFNLRRGFSVLEVLDEKKMEKKVIIARKGLHKFFDIQLNFLDLENVQEVPNHIFKGINTSKVQNKCNAIILDPIRQVFKNQEKENNTSNNAGVLVYKSEKANGENAQVSYNKELDVWVICSKNVSILVKSEQDIEFYEKSTVKRFQFATLIARCWLNILKNKVQPEKLAELKEFMDGKTFVAEYCGNQDYQHLVKYTEIDLLFYAIVENESELDCMPLEYSSEIFKHFGLTLCKFEKFYTANWDEFNHTVFKLYERVSRASVEEEGEGGVLYFFEKTSEGQINPLSLCKLKTIEYRLFRKLREKLKTVIRKPNEANRIFNKYKTESEELVFDFPAKQDLKYYFDIAESAFSYVMNTKNQAEINLIHDRYIFFLDMITDASKQKKDINREFITQQLKDMPLTKEEREELEKQDFTPAQIVIISPAFYLGNEIQQMIQKEINVKEITQEWNATKCRISQDQHTIINIHTFPTEIKESHAEQLISNTFFIICGFSQNGKEYVQPIIELKKDEKDTLTQTQKKKEKKAKKGNLDAPTRPYIDAKDFDKFFESTQIKISNLVQNLEKVMPDNFVVIDDVYNGQKKDIQFEKIGNDFIEKIKDSVVQLSLNKLELINSISQKKSSSQQKTSQVEVPKVDQELIVLVPLTIPATGKSTFIQALKEKENNDFGLQIVSSDQIRRKLMDSEKTKKSNKKLSKQELFDKTDKQARIDWKEEVKKALKELSNNGKSKNILFLDKNHPSNSVQSTFDTIRENTPNSSKSKGSIDLKIIAIVPQCEEEISTQKLNFPFSYQYLMTCLNRAINREEHETLDGDTYKVGAVVMMFFNLFRQVSFTGFSMKKSGFDDFISLPFHKEDEDSVHKIPKKLKDKLEDTLLSIKPKQNIEDNEMIQAYITEFLESKIKIEEIDREEQLQVFSKKISYLFTQNEKENNEEIQKQQQQEDQN